MTKEIVLSWTREGYAFTIDGVKQDFPVKSAAMKMGPGRTPSIVIELDAELVRLEHGSIGYPVCNEGSLCVLPPRHEGEHEYEPVNWAEEPEPAQL